MNVALELKNVTVMLGGQQIVREVSGVFERGQFIGLLGPNGAGKTTLLKAMIGLLPLSLGQVWMQGVDVSARPPHHLQFMLSYLPQAQVAHWPLKVRDLVALGSAGRGQTKDDDTAITRAIDQTGLQNLAHRPLSDLSGGERARALLARVLASDAPLIFADEPIASLDPYHQLMVMQLMKDAAGRGRTIVAVLHDVNLAARFCDQLVIMDQGRLVTSGPSSIILQSDVLASVYGVKVDYQQAVSFSLEEHD